MEETTSQFLNDENISKEVRDKIYHISNMINLFVESYDTSHFLYVRVTTR